MTQATTQASGHSAVVTVPPAELTPVQNLRLQLTLMVATRTDAHFAPQREKVAEAVLAYERLVLNGEPLPLTPPSPTSSIPRSV
jgi:hypothetical protein